jgi:hypothetical protein
MAFVKSLLTRLPLAVPLLRAREESGDWRVVIIDSTTRRHHAADTRAGGTDGVGRGTIWMTVEAEGRPVGVRPRSPSNRPRSTLALYITCDCELA